MRELQFLIEDVREQTDNRDVNGIKDREIVRYFNDGVKTIQALIFKNNPLCSYYQEPVIFSPVNNEREYTLPSTCFADNAVSQVEMETSSGQWTTLERVWAEENGNFFGWFTRNKKVIISGCEDRALNERIRVHFFKRLPRFDKPWAKVASVAGQNITMEDVDAEMFKIDRFITILQADGSARVAALPYTRTDDTHITVVGSLAGVEAGDQIVMSKNSSLDLDLPEECEPYLMDYVAQRMAGRQAYGEDWNKMNFWTSEERSNIVAIFADASQAQTRAPITDTDYMRI